MLSWVVDREKLNGVTDGTISVPPLVSKYHERRSDSPTPCALSRVLFVNNTSFTTVSCRLKTARPSFRLSKPSGYTHLQKHGENQNRFESLPVRPATPQHAVEVRSLRQGLPGCSLHDEPVVARVMDNSDDLGDVGVVHEARHIHLIARAAVGSEVSLEYLVENVSRFVSPCYAELLL